MSASAFSVYALSRALRAGDSSRFGVDLKTQKSAEIAKALECARDPQSLSDFEEVRLGDKLGVAYQDYSTTLVLRALAANIKYRSRIRMPSRDRIVNGVIQSIRDATPMYIYRRDIRSFYESVPLEPIRAGLLMTATLSPLANKVLSEFLHVHCRGNSHGLPRGVSVSAVLSEYVLQDFDRTALLQPYVYRYFRFADDILVMSYKEIPDIDGVLSRILPDGLALSPKPHKRWDVKLPDAPSARNYEKFEYLGYDFFMSTKVDKQTVSRREISVTIADNKVKRIKSRVIVALKQFALTKDSDLLVDRLRYLCSNFAVKRTGLTTSGPKRTVKSGIYYNYRRCLNAAPKAMLPDYDDRLKELDGFLHNLLFAPSSEFSGPISRELSRAQKAELSSLSFLAGYHTPMMIRLNPERLGAIKSVWAHV